jgi:SAM-dependent methyltransferase
MEDLPFYLALASQQGGPVLELGCGTGRILKPFADAGYPITGLDLDFDMLAYLHEQVKRNGKHPVSIFQADMSAFCLGRSFPFIFLPCNTYNGLPPSVRQKTLERVHHHLAPGGIFVVSLPNPAILFDLEDEAEAEIEDEFTLPAGEAVQVSSAWKKDENQVTIEWQYDLLSHDGTISRYCMEAIHCLISLETYQDEFQRAGLIVRSIYGDYDFSPYTPDAPYLIFVLTKND